MPTEKKSLATTLKGVAELSILAYVGTVAVRGFIEMGEDVADYLRNRKKSPRA